MAARLEVSATWLSRYRQIARMPQEVRDAFPSVRNLREVHARQLKPHLGRAAEREAILVEARAISADAKGLGATEVMRRLRGAVAKPLAKVGRGIRYRRAPEESGILVRRKGCDVTVTSGANLSRNALETAFE